jgi:hypothetical protein
VIRDPYAEGAQLTEHKNAHRVDAAILQNRLSHRPNRAINPKKIVMSTPAQSNPGKIHQPFTKRELRPSSPNSRLEISSAFR